MPTSLSRYTTGIHHDRYAGVVTYFLVSASRADAELNQWFAGPAKPRIPIAIMGDFGLPFIKSWSYHVRTEASNLNITAPLRLKGQHAAMEFELPCPHQAGRRRTGGAAEAAQAEPWSNLWTRMRTQLRGPSPDALGSCSRPIRSDQAARRRTNAVGGQPLPSCTRSAQLPRCRCYPTPQPRTYKVAFSWPILTETASPPG